MSHYMLIVYIYSDFSSIRQDVTRSVFKLYNWFEFRVFILLDCFSICPLLERRKNGFMPFPKVLG